jgi:hypothetical protein
MRVDSHRRTVHPSGFATMLVIVLLMLSGAAVLALSTQFAGDARRTQRATVGAQLRQLLEAAIPIAQAQLAEERADLRDLTVPTPVAGASLVLHFAPAGEGAGGGVREVRVVAGWRSMQAREKLDFAKVGNRWSLQNAALTQSP